jgi:tRNA pseudouridine13 synthase
VEAHYLTADVPGIGGALKRHPDDFQVEEVPLYEAAGEGPHTLVEIEKRGISTFEAVQRIADALGVSPASIGYAGLKDTRAVAVQRISVEGLDIEDALDLSLPAIRVRSAAYHHNRLRIGHLAGNCFRIRVRDAGPGALQHARAALDILEQSGVPNFFGLQRFSTRRNAHLIGRAILLEDWGAVLDMYLGNPQQHEAPFVRDARAAFEAGEFDAARRRLPLPRYREERKVLGALLRGLPPAEAFQAVNGRIRRLFVSAYQSALFNRVAARRLPDIGRLMEGDLAFKHRGGAVFPVESAEQEQPRADAFEISPSGPLFGAQMPWPAGEPRRIEEEVLAAEALPPERLPDVMQAFGGRRRPLRVPLMEPSLSAGRDGSLVVSFRLPSGSYATVVMDEIMKTGDQPVFDEPDADEDNGAE